MTKHLSDLEREDIFKYLNEDRNLNQIAKLLGRDRKTIVLEIKRNRSEVHRARYGRRKIFCQKAWDKSCKKKQVCSKCIQPNRYCSFCQKCINECKEFKVASCQRITSSPFCCNACPEEKSCLIAHYVYSPSKAQNKYEKRLVESREGTSLSEKQLKDIEEIVQAGLEKGQSLYHITESNKDKLPCSVRTIYLLKDNKQINISNLDMPRTVQRKLRKAKKPNHKVDTNCLEGRRYKDFLKFRENNPEINHVQMDTVEGVEEDAKCLLSLSFPHLQLVLCFLLERQTAYEVTKCFHWLYEQLGEEDFKKLFPLILTDRGSEFSDPTKLEALGTKVFYCEASSAHQKGHIENQNGMLRRIVPKKYHIDGLDFEDSFLINSHLASYRKVSLNNKTPYDLLSFTYGEKVCKALMLEKIPANDVVLKLPLAAGQNKEKTVQQIN